MIKNNYLTPTHVTAKTARKLFVLNSVESPNVKMTLAQENLSLSISLSISLKS